MRISSIEAVVLQWPAASRDYWVSISPIGPVTELLVRVRTDSGLVGIGEGHGSGLAVRDLMAPLLKGEDPLDSERLWEKMFSLTCKRGWRQAGHTREERQ